MEKPNDYIDFCGNLQRPGEVFGHGRCSPATLVYLVLVAFGVSAGAFVAEAVCPLAGFLAFFLDFLVVVVEVFFISVLASDLAAIGAAAAGAAGVAAVALAGAAGAVVAVCAAAVSDTANAPASSALNNLVMAIPSV